MRLIANILTGVREHLFVWLVEGRKHPPRIITIGPWGGGGVTANIIQYLEVHRLKSCTWVQLYLKFKDLLLQVTYQNKLSKNRSRSWKKKKTCLSWTRSWQEKIAVYSENKKKFNYTKRPKQVLIKNFLKLIWINYISKVN